MDTTNTNATNINTTKSVNIFAVGDLLDPHLALNGECRPCEGSGSLGGQPCGNCAGSGKVTRQVRLVELVKSLGPALEYVKTVQEPINTPEAGQEPVNAPEAGGIS